MKTLTAEKITNTYVKHGPLGLKQLLIRGRWPYERRMSMYTALIKGHFDEEAKRAATEVQPAIPVSPRPVTGQAV